MSTQFYRLYRFMTLPHGEGFCALKHPAHISHIGHVPIVERLVEGKLHDSL